MNKLVKQWMLGAAVALLSLGAMAQPGAYPGGGQAPAMFSFVATADGPVTAYYTNWKGSLTALVGLRLNGVDGPSGLSNQLSGYGDSLVLGNVLAGQQLTFFLDVPQASVHYYSNASMNHDGVNGANVNHVWVSTYAGDSGLPPGAPALPAGLLLAFEDLPGTGADFNYHDHGIVVLNVTAVPLPAPVPEPASWALLLCGAAGLALLRRRR